MTAEDTSGAAGSGPYTNFNFVVEIDGIPETGFCSVEGFESAVENSLTSKREGARGRTKPGEKSFANVILRRGIGESKSLWRWHRDVLLGKDVRKSVVFKVLNEARRPVLTIHVKDAWPRRWKLGKLDALHGEILIEEVELVIGDFRLE